MVEIVKPRPLPSGGTIAFTAPGSTPDPQKLKSSAAYFSQKGYRIRIGKSCTSYQQYLAGPAADRAGELLDFFEDESVDAIFSVRGGFGSIGLLPLLDYNLIHDNPKLFTGFSDITALQCALLTRAGLVTLSGALPAVDFFEKPDPHTESSFWNLISTGHFTETFQPEFSSQNGAPEAAGTLIPGTLSLFSKLIGTRYLPPLTSCIPVLEDVGEPVHKIEGYLAHLVLSGWVAASSATILGSFSPAEKEEFPEVPSLETVIKRQLGPLPGHWAAGISYGHQSARISLPFGIRVSVSFGRSCSIRSLESLFSD